MSWAGKDSAEVVEFLRIFAQLKDWSNDAPDELADSADHDQSIKVFCGRLRWVGQNLKREERNHRALFATPVDPTFLAEWRDYEKRYESILSGIWFDNLFKGLGPRLPSRTPKSERDWQIADDIADRGREMIVRSPSTPRLAVAK
ncbi:hypothetical protein [Pelagibius marinus]|uniref:hypothetical protein n=1 Tax=Pelagibius marinus TaxID=2762760 RepID=UPI0018728218|nr:hypothetical protein [Pelagibius marinus]